MLSHHFQIFLGNEQSFKGQILFKASMLISVMNLNMTSLFQVRLKFKPDPLPRNNVLFSFSQSLRNTSEELLNYFSHAVDFVNMSYPYPDRLVGQLL